MISSDKRFKVMILMEKPAGLHFGITFDCVAAPGDDQYSWMDLPTMLSDLILLGFGIAPTA